MITQLWCTVDDWSKTTNHSLSEGSPSPQSFLIQFSRAKGYQMILEITASTTWYGYGYQLGTGALPIGSLHLVCSFFFAKFVTL
jgi:hypothetical protein